MFSRLEHQTPPVYFPDEWTKELKQILLNTYGEKCIDNDATFEVYAFSYPTEALLIISYAPLDKNLSPVTIFLSSDLNDKTNSKTITNDMFDASGIFFDQFFTQLDSLKDQDEIWDDYVFEWDEVDFTNSKFFYKISRENVGLTIQANILLGE